MQPKSTVRETLETSEIKEALGKTRTLATEEEKVLRMRHGAGAAKTAPLQRHGEGNQELQDELLLMEMELLRAYRQHQKQLAQAAAPKQSRTKDKIVRALRKKH